MLKPNVKIAIPVTLLLVVAIAWYSSVDAPPSPAAEPKSTKLQELLKERLATVREVAAQTTKQYQVGAVPFAQVHQAMQAVLSAELDLCASDKERITILERAVAQAKELERRADARAKTGLALGTEVLMAKAARLEVEIALERAKSKVEDRPR